MNLRLERSAAEEVAGTKAGGVCRNCGSGIPPDSPEGGRARCLLETARDVGSGQRVFERFTAVKVLGRGGMGIVWLARDEELERHLALKFLPHVMIQDRGSLDQLKRETKRSLELTHPHIVRIHDFVRDEHSGCISMEYVDGETLSNLRAEREHQVFEPMRLSAGIRPNRGCRRSRSSYNFRPTLMMHTCLK